MIAHGEVFLAALGEDAHRLHPEILAALRATDTQRVAHGVFEVAGSRFRRLGALAWPVVGPDAVVTRFERDVPFVVRTRSGTDAAGRAILDTTREFRFRGGVQRIRDRLTVSVRPGLVRNLLGVAGRVELIEECIVSEHGSLRMRTRRAAIRVAGRRIALPRLFRVDVRVEDGWDAAACRRTITLRARNPILGTVLEYRGWYRFDVD